MRSKKNKPAVESPAPIPPPPVAAPAPLPDWITWTPEINSGYYLHLEINSTFEQVVDLTREEFIELKAHLAKLRGYAVEAGDAEKKG